jgi:hypothetical protein
MQIFAYFLFKKLLNSYKYKEKKRKEKKDLQFIFL